MKTLEYVPVPAFEDNYIWLVSDGQDAVVVDPGDAAPCEAYLAKRGWRLTAILLTHHHHDHVGGVADLLVSHSPMAASRSIGPAGEAIEHLTQRLKQGDRVSIASPALEFSVIDVPGHTAGHIAYFQAGDPHGTPHLFCGDTLFASGCGRLFEGTPHQMLAFARRARRASRRHAGSLRPRIYAVEHPLRPRRRTCKRGAGALAEGSGELARRATSRPFRPRSRTNESASTRSCASAKKASRPRLPPSSSARCATGSTLSR